MPAGSLKWIPKGRPGTQKTIEEMKNLVDRGKINPDIISLATRIVALSPERNARSEVNALFTWVKRNIAFRSDPYRTELIQDPAYTVKRRAGDCDDLSTVLNALAASIGFDTRFKTIKADPYNKGEFTHVYSEININGEWVPADPSQKHRRLGWEPPLHFGSEVWGYSDGRLTRTSVPPSTSTQMKGLGMLGIQRPQRLDIKRAVMDLFSGRASQAQQTMPAIRQPVVQSVAQPRGQDEINPQRLPAYDPEEHTYYNDSESEGGGKYAMERPEMVSEPGSAITTIYRLPYVRPAIYNKNRRMDDKFKGEMTRMSTPIPDLTAVKDGSPAGYEEEEVF